MNQTRVPKNQADNLRLELLMRVSNPGAHTRRDVSASIRMYDDGQTRQAGICASACVGDVSSYLVKEYVKPAKQLRLERTPRCGGVRASMADGPRISSPSGPCLQLVDRVPVNNRGIVGRSIGGTAMNLMGPSFGESGAQRQSAPPAKSGSTVGSIATRLVAGLIVGELALAMGTVHASDADDRQTVAALDAQYQQAVKENDARTMAAILAEDFVLVIGNGKRFTKADLLNSATDGKTRYEHQEDTERTVMVSGDTAVVTAKLWAKGLEDVTKIDYTLWFSDVYVRTPKGWRYYFGQASLPLPATSRH
jgi:ketosteroid isomerase-like protein